MELEAAYGDIVAEGAELIALSTDSLADAQAMVAHAGVTFPVLADADAAVTREYGIFDLLDDGVAAPATFIVDSDLQLVGTHVGQTIADRVPAATIIAFLRELNGTIDTTSS